MQAPQLSRRERKKRENRQRIVQAAIDLFQAQGFDHTPIEAITEKADVSRGTFSIISPAKRACWPRSPP